MGVSVDNLQIDEFMESVMATEFADQETVIRAYFQGFIKSALEPAIETCNALCETHIGHTNGNITKTNGSLGQPQTASLPDQAMPLIASMEHMLCHECVRNASKADRKKLLSELFDFIAANMAQSKDNRNSCQTVTTTKA